MTKVVEDGECLLPGVAGGGGLTGGIVGIAEEVQRFGEFIVIVRFPKQADGAPVAVDGQGVMALPQVDVAEAVPGMGLLVVAADLLQQVQGLLAAGQRALVVAEVGGVPADPVEGAGMNVGMPGLAGQLKATLGVRQRFAVAALDGERHGQAALHPSHAGQVTDFGVKIEGLPEICPCLLAVTLAQAHSARRPQHTGLRVFVPKAMGRGQGRALQPGPVTPAPVPVNVTGDCRGQLPGMSIETGACGKAGHGEQDLVLGVEPAHRLLAGAEALRHRHALSRGRGKRMVLRVEPGMGAQGSLQIVVEHPAGGVAALACRDGRESLVRGVVPDQVMQDKPARAVLGDQVQSG